MPRIRRHRFGPRVIEIAKYLAPQVGDDLIPTLHTVVDRWPDLSAHDLIGAMVLAEAMAMRPEGSA